jgi:hypothetical protein
MKISLLDLISTPVPVLNSLGVKTRVGLSSEDPMVIRRPSEEYQAYLTVYSPEGVLLARPHLGEIPPNRRKFFDVSAIAGEFVPNGDHLSVVHRVPRSLLVKVSSVDELLEVDKPPDYSFFRSLVEYSYPGGGNGSVIYETPPFLNVPRTGRPPSNTLSFTSKVVLTEVVNTYVVLIHYSMDPSYTKVCEYNFILFSMAGEPVTSGRLSLGPFSVGVIDVAGLIPSVAFQEALDPSDGLAPFTFVGFSEQASLPTLIVNAARNLGAVSVEHIHPAQEYLLPSDVNQRRSVKSNAIHRWEAKFRSIGTAGGGRPS